MLCVGISVLVWPVAARSPAQSGAPSTSESRWDPSVVGAPLLRDPIWVYNDWSAYDELSDNIPLTEDLAMRELNEILRLRKLGVHFDYYMMEPILVREGRSFTEPGERQNWPNGPDRWIAECKKNGILPGLWFGSNELVKIDGRLLSGRIR